MVRRECVHGLCACIVDKIGIDTWSGGLGEELVRYNWLFGKLIMPLYVCRKLVPNTTGKRIFLVTTSCTQNELLLIAMENVAVPNATRGLSPASETENQIGCSGGMKDSEKYRCSSKRLIEEPASIKIVMGMSSKLLDTRHWRSSKA